LLAGVFAAYSNHFENAFHFDDYNTIVDNPAIRTLDNIPRFFSDATLFSTIVTNQSYRPLLATSIAIDYMLGGGLNPFWFHVSTFLWFLVQLVLMYALFMYVLDHTRPGPENWWLAWLAVAIYGLHPVSAETVNYIIQRGDLYAALGIVAGVVVYAWKPSLRRRGFYLLPPLAAMLAKPPSLIFAPLLLIYIVLIDPVDLVRAAREKKRAGRDRRASTPVVESNRKKSRNAPPSPVPAEIEVAPDGRSAPGWWRSKQFLESCARKSVPAFLLCAAFSYFEKAMTPPTFSSTTLSSLDYWITQPYVTLRYFCSFFLPLSLKVDTDMRAFQSMWNLPALAGIAFCILLIVAAIRTARLPEWRPVSFGLWWFLIGLVPTALYPLNEVENDHRMFLPFVGLSLAVVCAGANLVRLCTFARFRQAVAWGALAVLPVLGWGTHLRNEVWHTDEGLWRDDIQKSPNNARGYFSLGFALWKVPGRLPEAISYYETALRLKPDYKEAHRNLGLALAEVPGRRPEAMAHYQAALRIDPDYPEAHNDLGIALAQIPGRLPAAISEFRTALRLKPDYADPHLNLGIALSQIPGRMPEAVAELQTAFRIRPDPTLRRVLDQLQKN